MATHARKHCLTATASLRNPMERAAMVKMRRKADLPSKPCAACGRPFVWRKKWARDWEAVRYCSERCRSAKAGQKTPGITR
ncbi:DUF2256 domain-containing protein [Komagataeibacter xylinus]|uniref:DUF2256 domain-containing protein n=1 Tax=Komagataeibacter xylinus TaxID=28448 RepID=UPI0038D196CF